MDSPHNEALDQSAAEIIEAYASEVGRSTAEGIRQTLTQIYQRHDEEIINRAYIEDMERLKALSVMGMPNEEQLQLIQSITGVHSAAEDWFVAGFRASDNLIDYGWRAWHSNVLVGMGKDFQGKPLLLNHEWGNIEKSVGFVMQPKLIVDHGVDNEVLDAAGFKKLNQGIVKRGGYQWLHLTGVISTDSQVVEGIKSRRLQDVSTGSHLIDARFICPNCSEKHGEEIGFMDRDAKGGFICPHLIPSGFAKWLYENYGDPDEDPNFADYAILNGKNSSVELSLCVEGALPNAGVLRAV